MLNIIKQRKIINYPPYSKEIIVKIKNIKNINFLYFWIKIKKIIKKFNNKININKPILNKKKKNKYKWNIIIQSKFKKKLYIFTKKIIKIINLYNIKYKIYID